MASITSNFCANEQILPIKHPHLLKFKLDGIYKQMGGDEHTVKMSCSSVTVSLTTKAVVIEDGWSFMTNIESPATGKARLQLDVDGVPTKSIDFQFLNSKDVFQKAAYDSLIAESDYIKPFADKSSPAEYAGNYCMQAADRGLSELLSDVTNFYAVERTTHNRKNSIGFSGKTAIDRGKAIDKKGFVAVSHEFDKFKIDHAMKDQIYNAKDDADAEAQYKLVLYDIVTLTKANEATLNKFFTDDIAGKEIGYHVYYITVTNGFHTLLLIIDTMRNPCSPTYEIRDQHAKSSSYGDLKDVAKGILKQTSWTFANSCLHRKNNGTTNAWDSTKFFCWKMKVK